MIDTLSSLGMSARMIRLYSGTYFSLPGFAAAMPFSISGTNCCGSFTNLFTWPLPGSAGRKDTHRALVAFVAKRATRGYHMSRPDVAYSMIASHGRIMAAIWLNHSGLHHTGMPMKPCGRSPEFDIDGRSSALTRRGQAGSRTSSMVEQCTPPPPFWISS